MNIYLYFLEGSRERFWGFLDKYSPLFLRDFMMSTYISRIAKCTIAASIRNRIHYFMIKLQIKSLPGGVPSSKCLQFTIFAQPTHFEGGTTF